MLYTIYIVYYLFYLDIDDMYAIFLIVYYKVSYVNTKVKKKLVE